MSSTGRLDILRERNKALLAQLQQQRKKLEEAVSGGVENRKRDREDGTENSCEAEDEVLTIKDGNRGPARAALAKPKVKFSAHTSTMTSELRTDDLRHTAVSSRPNSSMKGQESEKTPSSLQQHSRPLLGYDWIAGVIDAEDSLIERSDDFFNDLCRFRALNREQCVNSRHSEFSEESDANLPSVSDTIPEIKNDTHQCIFSYRINNRLFPVPLNSEECCPVCNKHKSEHPHTVKEPALIRVSITHSTLLPPHKYKAHRRCSFDPSDSLSLPSHCLSGWSNKGQSTETAQSNLDLKSCLDTKKETENKEREDPSAFKTSDTRKPQQIPQVSLLSHHNFLHFSPRKRK
ncbi:hypothetical protein NL108_014016 [Boleophthalmus pectinirostris]|uniref:migration and invasion-inhibitory protein n=1 Tax=Boleophthalmus pectinirostris TaxID=150288 RepID=UPI000A1C4AB4|nr:migration and invasion-inhibitory protein [Boleophthalmus pectinirostris]KAJ0068896.1 hypothetical protein NL108_014016 [Boleophthalmus pectinirostris]